MDELKRARLEALIAWAGYFIAFVAISVFLFWAFVRP
jgi:hypothetical protein